MVDAGRLDRQLEFLPSHAQINARLAAGEGLTGPELARAAGLRQGRVCRRPCWPATCPTTRPTRPGCPSTSRGRCGTARRCAEQSITAHPLAREIVTTETVNELVNRAGITYAFRLEEEMAATPEDAIRAYTITSEVFDLPEVWADDRRAGQPGAGENPGHADPASRRLLDRSARWLLTRRPQPLDVLGEIARYAQPVADLTPQLPQAGLRGGRRERRPGRPPNWSTMGAPAQLASTRRVLAAHVQPARCRRRGRRHRPGPAASAPNCCTRCRRTWTSTAC